MSGGVRAMVFRGAESPLIETEFPRPEPAPGEVLVDVTCTTLCGSDLHTIAGRRSTPVPTVLGHEILGRVAELPAGEDVVDFAGQPLVVGDRVTWAVAVSCGECFYCRHELPQKCTWLLKYGHESTDGHRPLSGGLAALCHLAARTAIFRVPDELPDVVACPANCATATVAAAMRLAAPCRGEIAVVQGVGMLGLTACAMLREAGAGEIIACDTNDQRLRAAETFGASRTVDVASDDSRALREAIESATEGRGADLVFELSGSPDASEMSCELLRIGGRAIWVGAVSPGRQIQLAAETIVRRCLTIRGIHNYSPGDLAAALRFLAQHHQSYPFAGLVGATFPLSRVADAVTLAATGSTPRVAVVPDR